MVIFWCLRVHFLKYAVLKAKPKTVLVTDGSVVLMQLPSLGLPEHGEWLCGDILMKQITQLPSEVSTSLNSGRKRTLIYLEKRSWWSAIFRSGTQYNMVFSMLIVFVMILLHCRVSWLRILIILQAVYKCQVIYCPQQQIKSLHTCNMHFCQLSKSIVPTKVSDS